MRKIASALLSLLLTAALADAHEFSTSYSELAVDGSTVRVELTINLLDLHELQLPDPDKDGIIRAEALERIAGSLTSAILAHYKVGAPEPASMVHIEGHRFGADNLLRVKLRYVFDHELAALRVSSTLDKLTQANHRHLLLAANAVGQIHQVVLDRSSPSMEIDLRSPTFLANVRGFLALGLEHIVTGYDHLAFLAGLLLTTTTLKTMVKIVTSFTIAHSITLGLATFQLASLPPRFIESLIALSIAYVAIENFLGKTLMHRWKITFLFGLVHGFGFSNVLREMELSRSTLATSLFSFNLGVELGQLAFVGAVFPLIYVLRTTRWQEHVLTGSSLFIMSLGFYWFVQRAFFT